MPRNLISERSFTDRKQILGTRAEMIGWALLVLAGVVWMIRAAVVSRAETQQSATLEVSLVAMQALAVLMAVVAQVVIVLGANVQISTKPRDLWARLALPFLFILIPQGGSRGRGGHIESEAVWLFSPSLFLSMLAVAIVPALLIVWLTRRSKATQHGGPRQRHQRGTLP